MKVLNMNTTTHGKAKTSTSFNSEKYLNLSKVKQFNRRWKQRVEGELYVNYNFTPSSILTYLNILYIGLSIF